jgi:hypothetical protein
MDSRFRGNDSEELDGWAKPGHGKWSSSEGFWPSEQGCPATASWQRGACLTDVSMRDELRAKRPALG